MTKDEYKSKILDILHELNEKEDIIYNEAKENGILECGIDGNNHLFIEIEHEYHQKLLTLKKEYELNKNN